MCEKPTPLGVGWIAENIWYCMKYEKCGGEMRGF